MERHHSVEEIFPLFLSHNNKAHVTETAGLDLRKQEQTVL